MVKRAILGGLLLVGLATAVATVSGRAQDTIEADPCERACQAQKEACIDQCSGEENPVECETACADRCDDCLRGCGG